MPIIYKVNVETAAEDRMRNLADLAKRQWKDKRILVHDGLFEVFERGKVKSVSMDQAILGYVAFAQAILSGMFPELNLNAEMLRNPSYYTEEATTLLLEYIFGRR
jgi:hypothetical protein